MQLPDSVLIDSVLIDSVLIDSVLIRRQQSVCITYHITPDADFSNIS